MSVPNLFDSLHLPLFLRQIAFGDIDMRAADIWRGGRGEGIDEISPIVRRHVIVMTVFSSSVALNIESMRAMRVNL